MEMTHTISIPLDSFNPILVQFKPPDRRCADPGGRGFNPILVQFKRSLWGTRWTFSWSFNPILVQFKRPRAERYGMCDREFQSYLSPIQTYLC